MKEYDVIIIGAGPTGIFSALNIRNKKVLLVDANDEIGGKIKVSGGGRCNISNNKEIDLFLKSVHKNEKFLYPALNNFSPQNIIEYFKSKKVYLKEEEDNKMFPKSNDACEFIDFFKKQLESKSQLDMLLNYKVEDVIYEKEKFCINDEYRCKYLVMSTGGVTYPHISGGYIGHEILKNLGHSIGELNPASSPLVVTSDLISSKVLQGVTFKDIVGEVYINNKKKKTLHKDMLVTHFGLSGPLALDLSCFIKENLNRGKKVHLKIRFLNDIPKKVRDYVDENKEIIFEISDVKGMKVAFVTNGGISLKEVDPQSLESKIIDNLYIGGEVLNLHAITGGYNIAICLSEGKLIGDKINER